MKLVPSTNSKNAECVTNQLKHKNISWKPAQVFTPQTKQKYTKTNFLTKTPITSN